ncbi:MAG: protein translocase subunit SecD [Alphaproteobacteria bacterium]|nr:protein translocase subunit SecD [Alphaproteobacteria bacterium]
MFNYPKWKIALIGIIAVTGLFFCIPNFLPKSRQEKLPEWWRPMTLGLDLQGGSQLTLQVDLNQVVADQLNGILDAARSNLREKSIRYTGLAVADSALSVKIVKDEQLTRAKELLRKIDKGNLEITEEGNLLTVRFTQLALDKMKTAAVDQSIEIVRRRIDQLGTREPSIMRQGSDRIMVQLPGVEDPNEVKKLLGKTAKMSFHFIDDKTTLADARRGKISPESKVVPGAEDSDSAHYVIERKSIVGGEHLTDARADFAEGEPVVAFRFNSYGSKRFGAATRDGVGRRLAIVLDGRVLTAPEVKTAITGGSGIITGSFTVQSASELALMLRSGALPAPLEVVEERIVGPGLGTDSIDAGKKSCVIGLTLVLAFVLATYGLFGLFADIALVLNLFLLCGLMSALGCTLTLPGIAGIALTLGMAVDANVLIYERMREEQAFGKSILNTVEAGFENASSAIFDSNLTSLFAGAILIWLGNGPVRGFGVTTCLGLVTSVFTAVYVTKVLILAWIKFFKPKQLNV